jgi:hypothetical protein
MTTKESAAGCLLGFAAGDAKGHAVETGDSPQAGDETALVLCSAAALSSTRPGRLVDEVAEEAEINAFMSAACAGLSAWATIPGNKGGASLAILASCDALAAGKGWRETGGHGGRGAAPLALAVPLGPWMGLDATPRIVRFGQAVALPFSRDEIVGCAAVGVATMTALAAAGTPVGMWANEVMTVAGGISPGVSTAVETAAELAAAGASPGKSMSSGALGTGWQAHDAVGCALFCCMSSPASLEGAIEVASWAGNVRGVSALVGACMGARLGPGAVPAAWLDFDGAAEVRAAAEAFAGSIHV